MKTITIRDDTYRRLASLKGGKSFSDAIDELIRKDISRRIEMVINLSEDYGGSELEEVIAEIRRNFRLRARI